MGQKLGQNFLTNPTIAAKIAGAGNISAGELVLEVGPGKGILTNELLKLGANVVAVEKDSTLIPFLKERFGKEILENRLKITEGDILKETAQSLGLSQSDRHDFRNEDMSEQSESRSNKIMLVAKVDNSSYKIAANIPYYITGQFLRNWLSEKSQPSSMTILVQREVASRIVAREGRESVLSISVKCYGKPSVKGVVKAGSFSPPPKVDSAILSIDGISRDFFKNVDEEKFFKLLKTGFAHPRKILAGNLRKIAPNEAILSVFNATDLDLKVRAENLSLQNWAALAIALETMHISEKD